MYGRVEIEATDYQPHPVLDQSLIPITPRREYDSPLTLANGDEPADTAMVVYIVDDDASVRKAMARLMKAAHLPAQTFASGEEFLSSARPTDSDCVVIDVHMPGMSGLQVQEQLIRAGVGAPVILITAFDDDRTRDQARRAGAAGYFRKPFDDQALLDAISFATRRGGAPDSNH